VYFLEKFHIPRSGKIPRYNPQSTTIRGKYHDTTHTRYPYHQITQTISFHFMKNWIWKTLFLSRFPPKNSREPKNPRPKKFEFDIEAYTPGCVFSRRTQRKKPRCNPTGRSTGNRGQTRWFPKVRISQQQQCFSRFPAKPLRVSRRAQHQSCSSWNYLSIHNK
jgi:hypothetical protein